MLSWKWLTVDCRDIDLVSSFWAGVFGVEPEVDADGDTYVDPGAGVRMLFLGVSEPKTGKNRLHLDLTPSPGEWPAEVERLLALGATRADVGQIGDEPWVVLADPEGNEFCILSGTQTG